MTIESTTQVLFETISLSPQVASAIEDLNYDVATDIQAKAIPVMLKGKDVIGNSSTGTGKTAAFGIPAIECIDIRIKQPQVLVLSPTRELALQITGEMNKYAKYTEGIVIAAVFGGASMSDQIRLLKKANIVVGTPGRIMDHLRRRTLDLRNIKLVVLDEADEMLSMGFIEDIQTILLQAPSERQTALFSATMPPEIIKISKEFLKNPKVVNVMQESDNQADIEQTFYYVPRDKKADAMYLLLRYANAGRTMVFCNTKSMVDELTTKLCAQGFKATGLHGDMTQPVRNQVMQRFRNGSIEVLVATDVAARGIDVDDVETVINFDIPQTFEYYIHRIGRTGRAGKKGVSQTLVTNGKQVSTLRSLMRFTGAEIMEHDLPSSSDMMEKAVAKQAEELYPLLQKAPSKSAEKLMKRLLYAQQAGVTIDEIAYALAEKVMGGDEKFTATIQSNRDSSKKKVGPIKKGSSFVTVTASVGRRSKLSPSHFVSSIANAIDIAGADIGKIEIKEDVTRIGLYEEDAEALLKLRKPVRIKGVEVSFSSSLPSFGRKKQAPKHKTQNSASTKGHKRSTSKGSSKGRHR